MLALVDIVFQLCYGVCRALMGRDRLHADTFVIGIRRIEAIVEDFDQQVQHRSWVRIIPPTVVSVDAQHCEQQDLLGSILLVLILQSELHTEGHGLANESHHFIVSHFSLSSAP